MLGSTDKKTGLWLEEFTTPYYALIDAGVRVTIASPAGGAAPIDPSSEGDGAATDSTRRFKSDPAASAYCMRLFAHFKCITLLRRWRPPSNVSPHQSLR